MKTFFVRERADVIFEYYVDANDAEEACDIVHQGLSDHWHMEFIEHEVLGAEELTDDDNK